MIFTAPRSSSLPIRTLAIAAAALALCSAYGPPLWAFFGDLWARSYYQHFPYVILAAAVLSHLQIQKDTGVPSRPKTAYCMLAAAWAVLALAVFALSPFLAAVSAVLLVGGLLSAHCHNIGRSFPTGPWLLLWLIIPPPAGLDQRLLTELQLISSDLGSKALDLIGVDHLMEGNTLFLPNRQLFVDEACSGIVSVVSLSACGVIFGVWRRRRLTHIAALASIAVAWAVLMNVARITVIAVAEARVGIDLAQGVPHTILGLTVFAMNLLAIGAFDWLAFVILGQINADLSDSGHATTDSEPKLISAWNRLFAKNLTTDAHTSESRSMPKSLGLSTWLCLLLATSFTSVTAAAYLAPSQAGSTRLETLKLDDAAFVNMLTSPGMMPENFDGLRLTNVQTISRGSNNIWGQHSVMWEYRDSANRTHLLSCDLPFAGTWHELSTCYASIGWKVDSRDIIDIQDRRDVGVRLSLSKQGRPDSVVTFCCCLPSGDLVPPPLQWGTLGKLWQVLTRRGELAARHEYFQLQSRVECQDSSHLEAVELSRQLLSMLHQTVLTQLQLEATGLPNAD